MPPLAKHALREILGALRDGFAARDVRLGFALPACRKAGKKENSWGYARGSGSALYTRIKQRSVLE